MVKGLIIGKFMPPHLGHLALIKFGLKRCDKLIVAVCSRPGQAISPYLRYGWMKTLMREYPNVKVVQIKADLPQNKRSSRTSSKPWAEYCIKRFGKIDKIFSSELYGGYMAEFMNAKSVIFDTKRKLIPISGTKIRETPYKYWKYIPEVVRPYFVKTVCIYGPESTGKTTLAQSLAKHFKTTWVPEYARGLIASQGNKFTYKDFPKFVKGQIQSEKKAKGSANKLIFCDTDPITTYIYSKHYFGKVPRLVKEMANSEKHDFYLFCDIDLPWKADPQRDLGDRRPEFKKIFEEGLKTRSLPYDIVSGIGAQRVNKACDLLLQKFEGLTTN